MSDLKVGKQLKAKFGIRSIFEIYYVQGSYAVPVPEPIIYLKNTNNPKNIFYGRDQHLVTVPQSKIYEFFENL